MYAMEKGDKYGLTRRVSVRPDSNGRRHHGLDRATHLPLPFVGEDVPNFPAPPNLLRSPRLLTRPEVPSSKVSAVHFL